MHMDVNPGGTGRHVPPHFGNTPFDLRFLHIKLLTEVALPPPLHSSKD